VLQVTLFTQDNTQQQICKTVNLKQEIKLNKFN